MVPLICELCWSRLRSAFGISLTSSSGLGRITNVKVRSYVFASSWTTHHVTAAATAPRRTIAHERRRRCPTIVGSPRGTAVSRRKRFFGGCGSVGIRVGGGRSAPSVARQDGDDRADGEREVGADGLESPIADVHAATIIERGHPAGVGLPRAEQAGSVLQALCLPELVVGDRDE